MGFKSGFVAITGAPNAGKSSLFNAVVGEKIAIVTPKPQTTRHDIKGILSTERYQIVFIDTPGILEAHDRLNACLVQSAVEAIGGVDIVYHVLDILESTHEREKPIRDIMSSVSSGIAKFLVINKIDLLPEPSRWIDKIGDFIDQTLYREIIPVSSTAKMYLEELIQKTVDYLPEGQPLYDEELVTDRNERFLVSEIVREKIFEYTGEEIPYSIATLVDEFRENPDGKHFIRVIIYVERESQKGILIGKSGSLIRTIGTASRKDIQEIVQHPVYLELWVKVAKNWKKNDFDLKRFGYSVPPKIR